MGSPVADARTPLIPVAGTTVQGTYSPGVTSVDGTHLTSAGPPGGGTPRSVCSTLSDPELWPLQLLTPTHSSSWYHSPMAYTLA